MRRQVDHVATREEPPAPLKSICKHPGWELGPEWSRLCDQPDKHPTGFLLRWGDGGRDRADGAPRSPHVRGSKALSLQAQQTRKALLSNSFTERERKSPARFSANVLSGAKSSLSSQPSHEPNNLEAFIDGFLCPTIAWNLWWLWLSLLT